MTYIIIAGLALAYLTIFSLCAAAARSERNYERLLRRIEEEWPLP